MSHGEIAPQKAGGGEIGVTAAAEKKKAPGGIWAEGRDRQQRQKARCGGELPSFFPRPLRRRRRRLSLPIALSLRAAIDGDRIARKKEKRWRLRKGKTDLTLISPRTPEGEEDNRSKQGRGRSTDRIGGPNNRSSAINTKHIKYTQDSDGCDGGQPRRPLPALGGGRGGVRAPPSPPPQGLVRPAPPAAAAAGL